MDLINFVRVLLKKKKLLIIIPIIAVVASFILTMNLKNSYKSIAKISAGITDENQITIEGEVDLRPYVVQNKFSNLIELVKSKKVVDLVSYKVMLHDIENTNKFRPFSKLFSELDSSAINYIKDVLNDKYENMQELLNSDEGEKGIIKLIKSMAYDYKSILKKLNVYRIGGSDYIEITFESESAYLSAFIVNAVCNEFIRFYDLSNQIKSDKNVSFFEELANQKKAELDSLVNRLKNFKVNNQVINLYEQTKTLVIQMKDLEVLREKEKKNIPSLEEAINEINSKLGDKTKLYVEADLQPFQKNIIEKRKKLKNIRKQYIASGKYNQAVEDTLRKLKDELSGLIKNTSDALLVDPNVSKKELVSKRLKYQLEKELAEEAVKSYDREISRLRNQVEVYAPLEATNNAYEREISVAAEAYLVLLNKLSFAKFNSVSAGNGIKKMESGQAPDKPLSSKKMLLVIMAGFVSFVLTVVLIFILEYIDLTIKTPHRFLSMAKTNLLGYLSKFEGETINLKEIFSSHEKTGQSEIFTNLLKELRFNLSESLNGSKKLLLTSPGEKEGKTIIGISLAYAMANVGKKVLLVDTNFRNNELTKIFSAKNSLAGFIKDEEDIESAVTKTEIENIDIIGSANGFASPFEIAGSEKFIDKVNQLGNHYDYIFLEGPSFTKYSDSKELMNVADKIVPVFSADSTLVEADKNILRQLESREDQYIGSIINKVRLENIEGAYGEIPKKRGFIRRSVKKLLRRNLASAK